MVGLLIVQIRMLEENVTVYTQRFNLTVPTYLNQLRDVIKNDAEWVSSVNSFEGSERFRIESFEKDPSNKIFSDLKLKIDSVFARNNLNIEYEIKGIIQSNHRCSGQGNTGSGVPNRCGSVG